MKSLRATIPLPTADSQGVPFRRSDFEWFEHTLVQIGRGLRKHLYTQRAWDNDGKIDEEANFAYTVTIEACRRNGLEAFLDKARAVFRQKAICVEYDLVEKVLMTERGRESPPELVPAAEQAW